MSSHRPRVAITRAAEQAAGLADRLSAAGYEVLEVPVIAVVDVDSAPLAESLADLASFDWLVVTSPNGAARVRSAVQACEPAARPRTAVVGPGTASALGVPADLVASSSVGEGLVDDFPTGTGRVLLVQAESARPIVRQGLTEKGWSVTAVVAYRTVGVRPPDDQLARLRDADAVVFTSGSTVRYLVDAVGRVGLPSTVVSIGPVTSAIAEELGVEVTTTAGVHTLDGVVSALVAALPPPQGGGRAGRS